MAINIYDNVLSFINRLTDKLNTDLPTLVETYILKDLPRDVDDDNQPIADRYVAASGANKRPCIVKVIGGGDFDDPVGIYIWNPDEQGYELFAPYINTDGKIPSEYIPEYALNDVFTYTGSSGDLSNVVDYLKGITTSPKPEKGDIVVVNFSNSSSSEYNGTYLITKNVDSEFDKSGLTKIEYNVANDTTAGIVYTDRTNNCLVANEGLITLFLKDNAKGLDATGGLSLEPATTSNIGGVIVGSNINVSNGTISVATATSSTLGLVSIDTSNGLSISSGKVSLASATETVQGGVKLAESVSEGSTGVTTSAQVKEYVGEQIQSSLAPYAKSEDVTSEITSAVSEVSSEVTDAKKDILDLQSALASLKLWTGTQAQYDAQTKQSDTLYFITSE